MLTSTPTSVLLGPLPPLVRAALVCLLSHESAWQLLPVQPGRTNLLAAARQYQPGLVIVDESEMMQLAELAHVYPVPVLLHCSAPPQGGRIRAASRWNVRGYFGPLTPENQAGFTQPEVELLQKMRTASRPIGQVRSAAATTRLGTTTPVLLPTVLPSSVVVIGGSTGGSQALETIVQGLVPSMCTILVAIHLPAGFTHALVERLQRVSCLPVLTGESGTVLEPGKIIVVPGGGNTTVMTTTGTPWIRWHTSFAVGSEAHINLPSIDHLMQSVARTTGRPTLGVVLSGLGNDGTEGCRVIRQHGGQVVVQDAVTAAVSSMPQSVIRAGLANEVLPVQRLAACINRFAARSRGRRYSSLSQVASL